ncbi:MAG: cyclic lactone autoinducer peptide [Lachnospiraceae bacterium]|nr:cyclic lactone autoinducer peptide [Lachnospiraceae bacterium]MDE6253098.1 cyclic lactone autoinducer peptide [Lachnospiraceae bacterium]
MCVLDVFGKNYKTGGTCKVKENKKIKKMALKVVEKIVRNEVERDKYGDPPICFGIIHQPKRPKRKED